MLTRLKTALAGLPWSVVLLLGMACVVLGGVLIARPFGSLSVLHWLVAVALIVIGVTELVSAAASPRPWLSWVTGVGWIVAGVLAVAWPGITLYALAVVLGIALVLGGGVKIAGAFFGRGDERLILGLVGLTSVVVGLLVLSWPSATVLVLALVVGVGTALFGFGQIALAVKLRGAQPDSVEPGEGTSERTRWPMWVRLTAAITALVLALGGAAISAWVHRAQPDAPPAFYTAPSLLPGGPAGTIIRSEVIDDFHPGATAYRVLYKSTGYNGDPTAVSGIIVVPDGPAPADGRKVIAWTHGTVGVAPNCSPSLVPNYASALVGIAEFIEAGYVIAATDYQGLGTPGPHPYLVGDAEGMGALDNVRAARNLAEADASADFVVWGESQGGHASLFAGELASTYAPELNLHGVVASAPASDLVDLFKTKTSEGTAVGNILISMALSSWARVYDQADLDQIVTPAARPVVNRIAENCIQNPAQILASVPAASALNVTFLSNPPWDTEPWRAILADNTPGDARTDTPILITQGEADPVVSPAVQQQFVDRLCQTGATVDYRTYPGVGHVTVAHDTAPDVTQWIADRFAGMPAPSSCP